MADTAYERQLDVIGHKHRAYDAAAKMRTVYQDVIAGTERIRSKRATYIPQFPRESAESYKLRCDTATLLNFTRKTRDLMAGLVFQGEIELQTDVAAELRGLWENIDNQGSHGDVFCRRVFEDTLEGYAAVLVDAPDRTAENLEAERVMGLRPYWIAYSADQIWNWRYRINPVSKKRELAMIVLRDVSSEDAGKFLSKEHVWFRAFYLRDDPQTGTPLITWELWEETKQNEYDRNPVYRLDKSGTLPRLTAIPVAVIGELGTAPPLQDIALKNIEHIQTYSDYKSIIHKTCVPIPVRKGYQQPVEGSTPAVTASGDMLMDVPEGGDFGFAEVEGSSIEKVRQSLLDIREDIALMGLSILADKTAGVDLTATEAIINNVAETAELRVLARNLQDCIELALGTTAEYQGMQRDRGGSVVLGTAWNAAAKAAAEAREAEQQRTNTPAAAPQGANESEAVN